MGLRYDEGVVSALKREVVQMEESITYQEIVGMGRLQEARKIILLQGKAKFGKASRKAERTLEAITDLQKLEALSARFVEVDSWDELLAGS
jgi:hypothetical protein